MRTFLGVIALLLASVIGPCMVQAQEPERLMVDIQDAKLCWDWARGSAPMPTGQATEFWVKTGPSSGNYTKTFVLTHGPLPTFTGCVSVLEAIPGSGVWFTVVTAVNISLESGPSNEITYEAGSVPAAAANMRIQSQ